MIGCSCRFASFESGATDRVGRRWLGQTTTIYVGELVVDMYDSAQKNLIWRGVVSKTSDPKAKPQKQEANLNKAVTTLLANDPPGVK